MSEYTRVSISASGDGLLLTNSYGAVLSLPSEETTAIREFFQAERDAELGRWRWPEDPNIVVVPDSKDYYGDGKRWVNVYDERKMGKSSWYCSEQSSPGERGRQPLHDAAHDYFDSHPLRAPEPWDAAKPGELWLFTSHTGYEAPYRMTEAGNFNHAVTGSRISLDRMVDARLMWEKKEVSTDE